MLRPYVACFISSSSLRGLCVSLVGYLNPARNPECFGLEADSSPDAMMWGHFDPATDAR